MKTVLITGASSGISAGLARSFADDGYHVIACGRDPARLEALHQHSPNVTVRLFDMTDRDACRQALTGCYADVVILCAGTCEYLNFDMGPDYARTLAHLIGERLGAIEFLEPTFIVVSWMATGSAGARWEAPRSPGGLHLAATDAGRAL